MTSATATLQEGHPEAQGLATALVAAALLALALGAGPFGAAVLLAALAAALGTSRHPLRSLGLGLVMAVLVLDNPQEIPAAGHWQSPWYDVGSLLFDNLNKATGVDALRFSVLDVAIAGLCLAAAAWNGRAAPSCLPLRDLSIFAALALLLMEAKGLVLGGDFRNSLWQLRQPLAVPLLTLAFTRLLDIGRDRLALGVTVVGAAALKVVLGLYVYEGIFRPLNERPPYTNTHSDSVLFTVALVLVAGLALSRRTWGALLLAAGMVPALGVAILINNRRLAWVEVCVSAAVLFLLLPHSAWKRSLAHAALAVTPVVALYVAAGWSSHSRFFMPVQMARSLAFSDLDRSTASRDVENYNLIQTLKGNPVLGTGFGHEYRELSQVDDISRFFPQYRYIPHNSVLGLWAFGGLVGFTLVWLPIVVGLYLASRSYRAATTSLDRITAGALLAGLVAYTLQCWGDMGWHSWLGTILVSVGLAGASQLAVATGAWPPPELGRAT